ncbi:MAG: Purine nucleoside phosphorylase [candidate division Zixibacteria bacterium RBG-1]|nr:MAG: Purine nucleoside phosphorylase [candidate division Zixibacteria bacterium RBG-1]OGC84299.1 MAG: purine-nucleoside phosphorylase [candidate division Zixibacteria bacterium RBG_19FT_COMBO_42_43]
MSTPNLKQQITEAVNFIRTKTKLEPRIGIILGTGLGSLASGIKLETTVGYETIPHFPVSTVESHAGKLLFGDLSGNKVVAMQGRFHYYEGYSMQQVTFPVRVMKALGIKILIVSNACGGLNPQFKSGDLMLITDHINLQGDNPLIGPNDETLGPRFPDMYNCYDKELVQLAENVALNLGMKLNRGVYVSVSGPNLETAAEYRFLRTIGADVVGMSTVPEVIVARHQGTKVLGFSIITDMGLPDALKPTSLEEIIACANKSEPLLRQLISEVVEKIKF